LTAGISSLLLAALRSRDRLLLWLGVFSTLYAIRLFAVNGLVHAATGWGDEHFLRWSFCLTYVIAIPYALFARELLGTGWMRSISVWLWTEIAFAVTAIPALLFSRRWQLINPVNDSLVVGGTLLILLHVILRRGSKYQITKGLAWPLVISGISVLFANWGFRPAGIDLEPLGFLILLGGLGFTASNEVIVRERKLVEVEQELTMARRIQSSIIPEFSPELSGLRLASRYQPMTSVAGDFFDFLKTGETSLSILVADVSGHGVPAALVASMLKVCFAAQRREANDPAKVLAGLNAMLRGSLGGQYVTAACAAIDLAARTVTYAGAGHPPSLLLRKNKGDVLQLAENGLFIGPFPQATYSNMTVPFESGDKLLLYTDGIIEATGTDGQEFGGKNLELLLLGAETLEPAEFIEELFRKIWTPLQQDDLTVVLTQFDPAVPSRSV
jgi:sigma-B regulation protein RsbU (phosphoserine phosphatase)